MREDQDLLGSRMIPQDAYYGIQTLRAVENFAVSGKTAAQVPYFLYSIAAIKQAAAIANTNIGALDKQIADVIIQAAEEVMFGKLDAHFPIDVFQGGGGTSTNMNMNEVLANRASEIATGAISYDFVHPNTHVNMGQSTNDVIPAAMKMTCRTNVKNLLAQLTALEKVLDDKSRAFASFVKLGRTCLQDAVPMTFGQQFSGYAAQVKRLKEALTQTNEGALVLPLGGTAVGTGLSTHEGYLEQVYLALREITGEAYQADANFFDAMQNGDFYLEVSAQLKKVASFLSKLATDLRIQGSGPRAGFNELMVPAVQPGSSIMPGKINPVIPELVNQVAYQVIGNDVTVTMAVEGGELDLNIWEPVIIKALFESCTLLTNVIPIFIEKCLQDLQVNEAVAKRYANESTALSTVIATILGYPVGSSVAQEAFQQQCTVKEVVLKRGLLTPEQAEYLLDPMSMTDPKLSTAAIKRYEKEGVKK